MNPALFALKNRTVMVVMTLLLIVSGILCYQNLGRLEYPNFTIKTALIVTQYPGASPAEVEDEVTDPLEEAIQSMGQLKEVYSTSQAGISFIYVDIKDKYKSKMMPQVWDELRRKVNDAQSQLPPRAGFSTVYDDFGDVYGVLFALTGDGSTYAELKDYAEDLKDDLLACDDVAKVAFWGIQQEMIHVEFDRARMSRLGLSPQRIAQTLQTQGAVVSSGQVDVGGDYLRISPTGEFSSEKQIEDLLIGGAEGLVRLGDVATVRRGYYDPARNQMIYNGQPSIGIGVSTITDGNVVTMGESIREKLAGLDALRPAGMELHPVYFQSEMVTKSVNTFGVNLIEAILIVVVLLMLFMGWQSGLLIGGVLVLTICGTFVGMQMMDITLQKVSLGALILALGMLVDNAIVVADGILVRVEKGESREEAAAEVVHDTQWPLLGATLVAILAFAAIGFSPGNVGEFCLSLFDVLAISLSISWVLAVTVTPLFCVWFLKIPEEKGVDPYDKPMFRNYRKLLHLTIHHRPITVAVTGLLMLVALIGFKSIPQSFFPGSTTPYFYVNYWRANGTHIDQTAADLKEIDAHLRTLDGVKNVTGFIGEGGLRFILTYNYENPNSSYGQLLVEVDDYKKIAALMDEMEIYLKANYPDAEPYCSDFPTGPSVNFNVEARFSGPDKTVLKQLADQTLAIVRNEPLAKQTRIDWRQQSQVLRPQFSESQGRRSGVSRSDLAQALQLSFNGIIAGVYREGQELIPIQFRLPEAERSTADHLENVQVWSALNQTFIPINQVVTGVKTVWEWPLIKRRDRVNAITIQCNPVAGVAEELRLKLKKKIDTIALPEGYSFEWAGEYEKSQESKEPLKAMFPLCFLGMFVIVVWLFNSVRRPLIIFMTVPLSIIGVTGALLLTGLPFGFMAILGFLGLSGMLIKNAIVLIDQIELELKQGTAPYKAVLDSSVSRMRPVMMTAGTTILGMAPLLQDPLYSGMAVTIMGGLFAATFLTLIVVPVAYTLVYRIPVNIEHL
jgi:multidrug efflux pump subunit AcrB